jgi:type I restriction enzyme M protein
VYEGLLAKNSEDSRSGAGQYFTPRALVDCMVACLQPRLGETIHDPAAGTGGFLISADHYVRTHSEATRYDKLPPNYEGMEIERGTYRLCLMNVFLHGMQATIHLGDTLTDDAKWLGAADAILANPPFGTRTGGARSAREDLAHHSANRQLQFLQHVYRALAPSGRAAIVLPDNVLFEGGQAKRVREELTDLCNVHTILRLPTGIFYAQNVSTHVLFFFRGTAEHPNTRDVWIYDLRTNMPRFGRRRQLSLEVFSDFIRAYGPSPTGDSPRTEGAFGGRLRRFSRRQLVDYDDSLIASWPDAQTRAVPAEDPETVALQMLEGLEWATSEVRAVIDRLASTQETSARD